MAGKRSDEFELEYHSDVDTNLDPHLQDILIARRTGRDVDPTLVYAAADGTTRVDVIAKLKDPGAAIPGFDPVRRIGNIVTGSVDVSQIESVRRDPNVVSLKRATILHPDLNVSVPEIEAAAVQIAPVTGGTAVTGAGVIVGVVDFGFDFVHPNFRKVDGKTRLLYLWDQGGGATSISPDGFGYGRELTAAGVNDALALVDGGGTAFDAYRGLSYFPEEGAHGTHVTDIAAGNGRGTGRKGVAPEADIIFVQLAANDFSDDDNFGNSRQLLEAVDYIFEKAAALGRPCVVNLSLGTHGGPHDGSTLVEQGFDTLLQTVGRAIVISAGNSFAARGHASGTLSAGQSRTLSLEIIPLDRTDNELEVWYSGSGTTLLPTLITPNGQRLGPVQPGTTTTIRRNGRAVGRIIHRQADPNNGDNDVDILLDRTMPSGTWRVELRVTSGSTAYHAWIERDHPDFQTRFISADVDTASTLGSISCSRNTIVVGSYNAAVPLRDISFFSAAGPTRDNRPKPEISAPGSNVNAANSTTTGSIRMSGTSMAAPHVTGLVALLFEAAPNPLPIANTRALVANAARSNPPQAQQWDPRFGVGRVSGRATLGALVPPAVAAVVPTRPSVPAPIEPARLSVQPAADAAPPLALTDIFAALSEVGKVRLQIEVESR
jgi:subtilisin family serine protease